MVRGGGLVGLVGLVGLAGLGEWDGGRMCSVMVIS